MIYLKDKKFIEVAKSYEGHLKELRAHILELEKTVIGLTLINNEAHRKLQEIILNE
jgi:hypothetical protein